MLYETYKLGKKRQDRAKKRYRYEELEQLELPQLREICNEESIKTPTVELLNKKDDLVSFLYRYLGMIEELQMESWEEAGCHRLESMIRVQKEKTIKDIEIPTKIKLYRDLDSFDEADTKYIVQSIDLLLGNYAFLVDDKNQIQAILEVSKGKSKLDISKKQHTYQLQLHKEQVSKLLKGGIYKNFSILFFLADSNEEVVKIYYGMEKKQKFLTCFKVEIPEVEVKQAEMTEEILVIDYGTSFTTAGTYSYQGKGFGRIHFPLVKSKCVQKTLEQQEESCTECSLCPSVIGIKKIEGNRIEFIYGQEAIEEEKKRGYLSKNSIFYDTKRWVNHYKEQIRVTDFDGNCCELMGGDLVRAFLLYIIKMAEQQNKVKYRTICLTCPVKQQYLSLKMYQDVLKEYQIVTKDVIDEAVAVLYDSLSKEITEMTYENGIEKKVLILDCGGGTSDMVRCNYKITDYSMTSQLDIRITYADGDTNFGGNNLTYRIFQYLKIQFAKFYETKTTVEFNVLMGNIYEQFYEWVDCHGVNACYKAWNETYEWAESIIPTRHAQYMANTESTYLKVKGNFYFLWQMAEEIKKKFYHKAGLVFLSLDKEFDADFHLYINKNHNYLELYTACPSILVIKEEIDLLLKPEIYGFMKHFVEPYYDSFELYEIDQIYLSGQTLSIELFRDILKEYIAGRKARAAGTYSCGKKLMCIDGAIAYQGAKRIGQIRPMITYDSPKIPYYLIIMDFHALDGEKVLIEEGTTMDRVYNYISRPIETKELLLTLKDRNKKVLNQITLLIEIKKFEPTTYEELLETYPMIWQKDLDNIISGEIKTFIYTDNRSWGYYVCHIARKEDNLYYKVPDFIPFEEKQWKLNFFDGMH